MSALPLLLSVRRSLYPSDEPHGSAKNAEYTANRTIALKRDDHTCRYCELRSKEWMHVDHIDDNHDNNAVDNLPVACCLCHMCKHVSYAGSKGLGIIIYVDNASGVTQSEFNALVRMLWIGELSDNPQIASQCKGQLERLQKASANARKQYKSSDPVVMGTCFQGLSDAAYANRATRLQGAFLLPLKEGYAGALKYWLKESRYPDTKQWIAIAEQKLQAIG